MLQANKVPTGIVPTGVDLAWVAENAEDIAKKALQSIGAKWEGQSDKNKKNWVENIHMFAEAALALAAERKAKNKVVTDDNAKA